MLLDQNTLELRGPQPCASVCNRMTNAEEVTAGTVEEALIHHLFKL